MYVYHVRGNVMIINGYKCDDKGKRIDRFDLEAAIMEAWQTVEDLKLVYEALEDMSTNQVKGAVDGARIFADMRCNKLWEIFEDVLHNMRVDRNGVYEPTAGLE